MTAQDLIKQGWVVMPREAALHVTTTLSLVCDLISSATDSEFRTFRFSHTLKAQIIQQRGGRFFINPDRTAPGIQEMVRKFMEEGINAQP